MRLLYATEYWLEHSGPHILAESWCNIQKLSVGLLSIDDEKEKRKKKHKKTSNPFHVFVTPEINYKKTEWKKICVALKQKIF